MLTNNDNPSINENYIQMKTRTLTIIIIAITAILFSSCSGNRQLTKAQKLREKTQKIYAAQKTQRAAEKTVLILSRQLTTVKNRAKIADSTSQIYQKLAEQLADSLASAKLKVDSAKYCVALLYGHVKTKKLRGGKLAFMGGSTQSAPISYRRSNPQVCTGGNCGGRAERQGYMHKW